MANKYENEVKALYTKGSVAVSDIEDMTMTTVLNVLMSEHLKDDPWLNENTHLKAGLSTDLALTMLRINSKYLCIFKHDLFTIDAVGDVEEFKTFAREMSKHSVSLQTMMVSVAYMNAKDA